METLSNFLGIPIDYYARISFQSLISIVDILGGVDVDVEIDFCEQDENRSFAEENVICLNAGPQTLDGREALAYARHRKTAGYDNAGRERAQKRIIKAMINKATSPSILLHISDLLTEMNQYLMTNISSNAILVSAEYAAYFFKMLLTYIYGRTFLNIDISCDKQNLILMVSADDKLPLTESEMRFLIKTARNAGMEIYPVENEIKLTISFSKAAPYRVYAISVGDGKRVMLSKFNEMFFKK